MARFAGEPVRQPKFKGEPVSPVGAARGMGQAFLQGALGGFGEELTAGLAAVPAALATGTSVGDAYSDIRDSERANMAGFREASPVASYGMEIAGAIAGPGKAAAGLSRTPQGAAITSRLATAPLTARTAAAAGAGAAGGGLFGAGTAEEGKRLEGAATGALLGGAMGGVLTPIMAGAKSVAGRAAQMARDRFGDAGGAARRKLLEAMARDELTPDLAKARMAELGPRAGLLDVSPNVRGLAEAGANRPGLARTMAEDFIERRKDSQFNYLFGEILDATPQQKALVPTETSAAFQAALNRQVPLTDDLLRTMNRPSMRTAYANAVRLAREKGADLPPVEDVLSGKFDGVDTTVMHWLKKGLDDAIEPKRGGVSGQIEAEFGRNALEAAKQTRRLFRERVKELNPEYAKQLKQIEGVKKLETAMTQGREMFFRPSVKVDDIKTMVNRMDPEERGAFLRGVVMSIDDKLSARGQMGDNITRPLLLQRDKIKAAFGDKADDLIKKFENERLFAANSNEVLGNSRTAYRENLTADLADSATMADIARGDARNIVNKVIDSAAGWLVRPPERVANELAGLIYNPQSVGMLDDIARNEYARQVANQQAAVQRGLLGNFAGSGAVMGLLN